jgi:hypothetical protein
MHPGGIHESDAAVEVHMGEIVPTARMRIVERQRPLRFGVHAGYVSCCKVKPAEPLPAAIDHLLAALAG